MSILPITEADLHAYADGRLAPARRAEVDAYLAARPDDAARDAPELATVQPRPRRLLE